jgi:hypothetical protein
MKTYGGLRTRGSGEGARSPVKYTLRKKSAAAPGRGFGAVQTAEKPLRASATTRNLIFYADQSNAKEMFRSGLERRVAFDNTVGMGGACVFYSSFY